MFLMVDGIRSHAKINLLYVFLIGGFNSMSVVSRRSVHLLMFSLSSFNQCSLQYYFQASGCFPIEPSSKPWTVVRESNELFRNDQHQSSERIVTEPEVRTSYPVTSCLQVFYATARATGLGMADLIYVCRHCCPLLTSTRREHA